MGVDDVHRWLHLEGDSAPQAGAHQPGHDVPAVGVGRPARKDGFHLREVETDRRGDALAAFDDGRADIHFQEVVRPGRRYGVRDIEVMLHQHVVGAADMPPVQVDLGEAVDAAEVQEEVVFLCVGRRGEMSAVAPLVSFIGTEQVDVAACLGILDEACGEQVEFHVAGHGGRHGLETDAVHPLRRDDGRPPLGPVIQCPSPVQGKGFRLQRKYGQQRTERPQGTNSEVSHIT